MKKVDSQSFFMNKASGKKYANQFFCSICAEKFDFWLD